MIFDNSERLEGKKAELSVKQKEGNKPHSKITNLSSARVERN